jgi:glycosyltransferase involved in cell wall biosynthesis
MNNDEKRKIIGIDARFYGPVGKGLGRYTKEVVDRLIVIDKKNNYVIFLCEENFENFDDSQENVKKILVTARWYTFSEQIIMPFLIFREKIDLMHFPHFNVPLLCPSKFVVTIHDLILIKHPTERASTLGPVIYIIKNLAYKIVIKHAIRRSRKIIAVSYYTKNDIINHFKVGHEKIIVTYEGVAKLENNSIDNNDKIANLSYNNIKPFLLYVGNAYPHKNLEGFIEIFDKIHKEEPDLNLILVGRDDYFFKRVKDFAKKFKSIENRVVFPGYVADQELVWFFQNASAYVFPSLYEGFGLPPLEAMSYGCPVVSSNKTSMPEILGDAAIYFDPEKEEETVSSVLKILHNNKLREDLVVRGYRQVKRYSWNECAKKTYEVFNKELKNSK